MKMERELIFEPEGHRYLLDGVEIPSVTQLVAPLGSQQEVDEGDDMELTIEAAAERGVVLHGYIEHRLKGGCRADYELPDAWMGYADAVDLFLAEHSVVPYLVETALYDLEGDGTAYAGTVDCVADLDNTLTVLDWKFVSQVQKTKVGAQLCGYHFLCVNNDIFPDALACVQFLPDGTYRLYPAGGGGVKDFDLCMELYKAKKKKHPKGGIA